MGRLAVLPLAMLLIASAVPSYGQKTAGARGGAGPGPGGERVVEVAAGGALRVECALRPEQRAQWRLDGGAVPADMAAAEAAGAAGLTARLQAAAARAHHAGLYTCAPGQPAVRVRVLPPATAPAAATEPAAAAGAGAGGSDPEMEAAPVYEYEVRSFNFSLDCTDLADGKKPEWKKNGTDISVWADTRSRLVAEGGVLRLAAGERAAETDWGNYSCRGAAGGRAWRVHGRPYAKLPADTSVVEGQKLKLTCKLVGMPYPPVEWTYSNLSEAMENATEVRAALGARASLRPSERGVPDGELVLEPAERADAGWYRCAPRAAADDKHAAVSRLRVKDKYAALWPFLGICAEVLVLCAIILVYERRRAKPELEDSDTDNHDQKKS